MKRILIGIVCSLCLPFVSFAQDVEDDEYNNFYLGAEFGRDFKNKTFIQGLLTVMMNKNYYQIKVTMLPERDHSANKENDKSNLGMSDVCFMMGKRLRFFKQQEIHFGTGLSLVTDVKKDERVPIIHPDQRQRYIEKVTIGLPLEIRYIFHVNRGIALNCAAHGDINPIRSFGGASVGLTIAMF